MKKKEVVTLKVSPQEYNYLHTSLWSGILNHRRVIAEFGRDHGNVAYLHDYSVRTLKKLERQREAERRKFLGPKRYRALKKRVNAFIRDFKRSRLTDTEE